MHQRPSWCYYIIPFLLKALSVAVFGCCLSISCVFRNLILKVLKVGCLENSDLENSDLRPQATETHTTKTQTMKTQTSKTQTTKTQTTKTQTSKTQTSKTQTSKTLFLTLFQLLFFIGFKPRQVSFVRITFGLSFRFSQFSNSFQKD